MKNKTILCLLILITLISACTPEEFKKSQENKNTSLDDTSITGLKIRNQQLELINANLESSNTKLGEQINFLNNEIKESRNKCVVIENNKSYVYQNPKAIIDNLEKERDQVLSERNELTKMLSACKSALSNYQRENN